MFEDINYSVDLFTTRSIIIDLLRNMHLKTVLVSTKTIFTP